MLVCNMYLHMYICFSVHVHTNMYIYIYMYKNTFIYIYLYIYIYMSPVDRAVRVHCVWGSLGGLPCALCHQVAPVPLSRLANGAGSFKGRPRAPLKQLVSAASARSCSCGGHCRRELLREDLRQALYLEYNRKLLPYRPHVALI